MIGQSVCIAARGQNPDWGSLNIYRRPRVQEPWAIDGTPLALLRFDSKMSNPWSAYTQSTVGRLRDDGSYKRLPHYFGLNPAWIAAGAEGWEYGTTGLREYGRGKRAPLKHLAVHTFHKLPVIRGDLRARPASKLARKTSCYLRTGNASVHG
jgi:hypothetical protein